MAAINGKITMSTCEGRPCWVKGRRAIFHRWTDSARPVKPVNNAQDTDERMQKWSVHGLVEYEDGTVEREWPSMIRFADSPEQFAAFDWATMETHRDACDHEERLGKDSVPEADNPACETCAHEDPATWAEQCSANDYDCPNCTADCMCKTCDAASKWEPKETQANG